MIATPGAVEPIEAAWLVDGVAQNGAATVAFSDHSTGAQRWWNGNGWQGAAISFPMADVGDEFRYLLTVPAAWRGLVVTVTCALPGHAPLVDRMLVLDPATAAAVAALGAPAQATDPRLAFLDAPVSGATLPTIARAEVQ